MLVSNRCMCLLPNDWRISCRPSCPRPHQPTLPSSAPSEGAARVESRAGPACRLHARVRLRPHYHAVLEATGSRSATRAPPGSATLFRGDRRTHRRSHGPAAWSGGEVSARIAPAPRREPSYHVLLRRSPHTTHAHPRMLPVCASHTTGSGALAVSPLASPVPLEGGRALEPAVVEAYGVLDKPECSRVSLTTCASAASDSLAHSLPYVPLNRHRHAALVGDLLGCACRLHALVRHRRTPESQSTPRARRSPIPDYSPRGPASTGNGRLEATGLRPRSARRRWSIARAIARCHAPAF